MRLLTEDHKIVHTCTTPHCLFTVIVRRGGGTAEILLKIEKNLNFYTCTCKSTYRVYIQGVKGQDRSYVL